MMMQKNQMGLNIGITVAKQKSGCLQSKEDKKPETKRLANNKILDRQPKESKIEERKWSEVLFKD